MKVRRIFFAYVWIRSSYDIYKSRNYLSFGGLPDILAWAAVHRQNDVKVAQSSAAKVSFDEVGLHLRDIDNVVIKNI